MRCINQLNKCYRIAGITDGILIWRIGGKLTWQILNLTKLFVTQLSILDMVINDKLKYWQILSNRQIKSLVNNTRYAVWFSNYYIWLSWMHGNGLSSNAHCEHLPDETKRRCNNNLFHKRKYINDSASSTRQIASVMR